MKVGFLGFGEVASTLSEGLLAHGVEVLTCVEGRSQRTINLAQSIGVEFVETPKHAAELSDILLSTVVPAEAIKVAKEVGKYVKGVYVDLNNVSPKTVKDALSHIKSGKTSDAAIMGSIKNSLGTPIIASGEYADTFAQLNQYGMNIQVIGTELGQASGLKMLRSTYTKGVSALLFEALYTAYEIGVDDLLLDYLTQTEGPNFPESAISRIKSTGFHAKRRAQEMEEVLKFLSDYQDPVMTRASREFFKSLPDKTGPISEKPEDYKDIFLKLHKKRDIDNKS